MTCAHCAELRAELQSLRAIAGDRDVRVARCMTWFAITETPARIALRLFDANGPISYARLADDTRRAHSKKAIFVQVCALRKELGADGIATVDGGYEMTAAGRAEIDRALAAGVA